MEAPSEIIVGSIRHIADINEAIQAGADIVTVPPKFLQQMVAHPKTDEAVNQFVTDFRSGSADIRGCLNASGAPAPGMAIST